MKAGLIIPNHSYEGQSPRSKPSVRKVTQVVPGYNEDVVFYTKNGKAKEHTTKLDSFARWAKKDVTDG